MSELTAAAKAKWCYAHASRPVAEVDGLNDDERTAVAAIYDGVAAGEVRLDVAIDGFLTDRRERLAELKAIDAAEDE